MQIKALRAAGIRARTGADPAHWVSELLAALRKSESASVAELHDTLGWPKAQISKRLRQARDWTLVEMVSESGSKKYARWVAA